MLIAVAVLVTACGGGSNQTSQKTPTAGALLADVKSALHKQVGVHVVVTVKPSPSSAEEKVVADFGTTSGIERISEGKATLTVEVTPADAYMKGNSSGLTTFLGLSQKQAQTVGAHWVSFTSRSAPYSGLKSTTTIGVLAQGLPQAKGTTLSSVIVNGSRQDILHWTSAATSSSPALSNTLTIEGFLPVEQRSTSSTGESIENLSHWGESIHISTPSSASTIPYTKI